MSYNERLLRNLKRKQGTDQKYHNKKESKKVIDILDGNELE